VLNAIPSQRAAEGLIDWMARPAWTALGDQYFPSGHVQRCELASKPTPHRRYIAPRMPNGIALDFFSPRTRGALPEISGDDVPFSYDERRDVQLSLIQASTNVRNASREVDRFLRALTKIVVLRKDSQPTHYTSASTPLLPGLVVLRNPHSAMPAQAALADGLVHETIHTALDLIDLKEPLITDRSLHSFEVASPWTSRKLHLNTYLQACFVWFGLWNFWLAALARGVFPRKDVSTLLHNSAIGFVRVGIVSGVQGARTGINPSVWSCLKNMQAWVRDDVRQLRAAASN